MDGGGALFLGSHERAITRSESAQIFQANLICNANEGARQGFSRA